MFGSIVAGILGKLMPEVGQYFIRKQELKAELQIKKLETKIAAENLLAQRVENSEARDHDWELLSLQAHTSGWKDEWVLILVSIPMILSFFPGSVAYVQMGFSALENTPSWYQLLILVIMFAVYGVRFWRRNMQR